MDNVLGLSNASSTGWDPDAAGYSGVMNTPDHPATNSGLVNDSETDAISQLAKDLNMKLDDQTKDYLVQYYLNQKSDQKAFDRSMLASNTQYQRAVEDLRKAGINPFLALQSLSGSSPTSSGANVTGGLYTSSSNAEKKNETSVMSRIIGVIGIIAAAIIGVMAA